MCLQNSEKGIRGPGTGDTMVVRHHVAAENRTQVPCRSNKCSSVAESSLYLPVVNFNISDVEIALFWKSDPLVFVLRQNLARVQFYLAEVQSRKNMGLAGEGARSAERLPCMQGALGSA